MSKNSLFSMDTLSSYLGKQDAKPTILGDDWDAKVAKAKESATVLADLQEKRRDHYMETYVYPYMNANPATRKQLAIKASEEIDDPSDVVFVAKQIANVANAVQWKADKEYDEKGVIGKAASTVAKVPQSIFRGGQKTLLAFEDLGRAIPSILNGADSNQQKLLYRDMLESAYQSGNPDIDPEANKLWQFTQAAGEQVANAFTGAKAFSLLGKTGLAGYAGLQAYGGERQEKIKRGASPTAATLAAIPSSAVQGAIEALNPIPYKASAGAAAIGEKLLGKVLKNKTAQKVAGQIVGGAVSAAQETFEEGGQAGVSEATSQLLGLPYQYEDGTKQQGRSLAPVLAEGARATKEAAGPMAIFGAFGAGAGIYNVAKNKQTVGHIDAIIDAAEQGRTPTRSEWKKWGLDVADGTSEEDRRVNVKEYASTLAQLREIQQRADAQRAQPVAEQATQAAVPQQAEAQPVPVTQEVQPTQEQPVPEVAQQAADPIDLQSQEIIASAATPAVESPSGQQQSPLAGTSESVEPVVPVERQRTMPQGKQEYTSLAADVVNEVREKSRDADPVGRAKAETIEQWVDDANTMVQDNPDILDDIIKEFHGTITQPANKRPLSERETVAFGLRHRWLYNKLEEATHQAEVAETPLARQQATSEANHILDKIDTIENEILPMIRSEAGRALRAFGLKFFEDFSVASLQSRLRTAKGGSLTPEEIDLINRQAAKIKELEARIALRDTGVRDIESAVEEAIDKDVQEVTKQQKREKLRIYKKSKAKQEIDDAWAKFNASTKSLPSISDFLKGESGALNIDAVTAAAGVVRAYVKSGAVTFAEIAANVKHKFGDKGNAVPLFQAAWDDLVKSGEIQERVLDPTDQKAVAKEAKRLQRSLVEAGERDRDTIVATVHAELAKHVPDMTPRGVMEILSDYGKTTVPSANEIDIALREMNGEIRQLAKIADLMEGKQPKPGQVRSVPTEAQQELIAKVRELKKQLPDTNSEKQAIDAYRKNLQERIGAYQKMRTEMIAGTYKKPVKGDKVYDKETTRLKYELEQEKSATRSVEEAMRKKRANIAAKSFHKAAQVFNTSRAIMTSFDISALLRQGGLVTLGRPKLLLKSVNATAKAVMEGKMGLFEVMENIKELPFAELHAPSGLAITVTEGRASKQEEAYLGEWSQYIPGVAMSERAYVAGLNQLRGELFAILCSTLAKDSAPTLDEAKMIANYVNIATGRGSLTAWAANFEGAAVGLAYAFWAPRYVASRFKYVGGQPIWAAKGRVRGLIAKEYGRTMIGFGVVMSMLAMAAKLYNDDDDNRPTVETDPRSGVFFRVRFGDRYYDLSSGIGQTITLLARLAPEAIGGGYKKTVDGRLIPLSGPDKPYGGDDQFDVLTRYVRTKFAPAVSSYIDAQTGKNVVGQDVGKLEALAGQVLPLAPRSTYEAYGQEGVAGAALTVPDYLGIGTAYIPKNRKKKRN